MSDMTDQGCSDGGCDLRDRRGGQHTNGGCHCLDALDGETRFRLRRYMRHTREARDALATQLEQATRDLADLRARGVVPDADCTCGSGGHPRPCDKHPHRMEMHAREIDTENALEQMRRERDEARATNARLHRRAQGVDARKPDDEETIRRLRAEVAATAKHTGYVAGHIYRIVDARNAEVRRAFRAERDRDAARAELAQCGARLERVQEAVGWLGNTTLGGSWTAMDVVNEVLRIIDEKEGGQ